MKQKKEALRTKIQTGKFAPEDLPTFFDVFSYLGNEIDDIQAESEGWNRLVELELTGVGSFWIQTENGVFANGTGTNDVAHLHLKMDTSIAVQIFMGQKEADSALDSGKLQVTGDLPDAIRFYEILELILEEIEY